MVKPIDSADTLPRTWELRTTRAHIHNAISTGTWPSFRKLADRYLDISYTLHLKYRAYKAEFGYLLGPVLFGVPMCLVWGALMRVYAKRLEAGKIRHHRHAPDYVKLPPRNMRDTPPWTDVVPRLRTQSSTTVEHCMEPGSRFSQIQRPAWQAAMLNAQKTARQQALADALSGAPVPGPARLAAESLPVTLSQCSATDGRSAPKTADSLHAKKT